MGFGSILKGAIGGAVKGATGGGGLGGALGGAVAGATGEGGGPIGKITDAITHRSPATDPVGFSGRRLSEDAKPTSAKKLRGTRGISSRR